MEAPQRFTDASEWLHAAATAQTGLSDFGPPDYRVGLKALLDALDHDGRPTAIGRQFALGMLTGVLAARLYTQEGWRRRPEYARVRIERPLIITGMPRTGTTALHKLLSTDPQFQGVEFWLANTPMPRPPRETWSGMPEYQASVAGLGALLQAAPGLAEAHDMTPDSVDECLNVMQQSFVSNMFGSSMGVLEYERWWQQQDEAASYRRYADVLRLIGLNEPNKRWLLKNPGHIWGIEHLFEVFPDACVVQTHRDPAKSIPSVCSLLEMSQRVFLGDAVEPQAIGRSEADKWQRAVGRADAYRARHRQQFHDVLHRDFHRDPMGTVRRIYERFELTLTDETEARMRRWVAEQPAEQKQGRRYSAHRYGLDEQGLRQQYAAYIERYDL
jgi:hypothetical protein